MGVNYSLNKKDSREKSPEIECLVDDLLGNNVDASLSVVSEVTHATRELHLRIVRPR